MNVLIFAAGLGTRLKPLTDTMPKALVSVNGQPLLLILIEKLKKECCDLSVVINIHHFGRQIIDFVENNNNFDIPIKFSDERNILLETGGGLKKAAPLFNNEQPILIHNVDILSNVNLYEFYKKHVSDAEVVATLIVSERQTKRYLLFNEEDRLVGWINIETGEIKGPYKNSDITKYKKYAFSGIHIVSNSLLQYMNSWEGKFPIMDFYLSICDKVVIKGDVRNDLKLLDVGKLDSINQAEKMIEEIDL